MQQTDKSALKKRSLGPIENWNITHLHLNLIKKKHTHTHIKTDRGRKGNSRREWGLFRMEAVKKVKDPEKTKMNSNINQQTSIDSSTASSVMPHETPSASDASTLARASEASRSIISSRSAFAVRSFSRSPSYDIMPRMQ